MNKYKIVGDKIIDFVTIVKADSPESALDAAKKLDTIKWAELENDRTIDPYDVEEIVDELDKSDI